MTMAGSLAKIAAGGIVVALAFVAYRIATAKVNEDNRNYVVVYSKPAGWTELPKNPQTLLFARDPKTKSTLRVSATQVVSETNPEPDIDTKALVDTVVRNAQANQPEYVTKQLADYNNGHVDFKLYQKTGKHKTIVVAVAVKGNTTMMASMSNTGEGGQKLAGGDHSQLLSFLDSVRLEETDKWDKLHQKLESD